MTRKHHQDPCHLVGEDVLSQKTTLDRTDLVVTGVGYGFLAQTILT